MKEVEELKLELESNVQALLAACSSEEQMDIFRKTQLLSHERQWIWSNVYRKLKSTMFKKDTAESTASANSEYRSGLSLVDKLNEALQNELAKLQVLSSDEWENSRQILSSIRFNIISLASKAKTETTDAVVSAVQLVELWHTQHNDEFLFSVDLKNAEGTESAWAVIECIRFLSAAVEFYPDHLAHASWDFILCSMSSWCSSLEESYNSTASNIPQSPLLLSFTFALCRLVRTIAELVAQIEEKKLDDAKFPPNLKNEWSDIFSEVAYNINIPLFVRLSKNSRAQAQGPVCDHLLETLALSFHHVSRRHIQLTVDQLSPFLISKQAAVQLAVYGLVLK